jgi:hypothetical protein
LTRGSTCSWVVRAVSRLPPATNGRPIQTRFPYGYGPEVLNRAADGNSPDHYAKGTPSRIAYAIALRPLVGTWFQVHIPPLTGVLLIFRSRYLFTIGHQVVFSLTGWSPSIQSRFHVTRPTQGTPSTEQLSFRVRACHPLWTTFPDHSASLLFVTPRGPYNPAVETTTVWAVSLSLAATEEIDFSFCSCGY